MSNTIMRPMNQSDGQFIDVNLNKPKRKKTSREVFTKELQKQEIIATKKGLPFARHAVRDDFERDLKAQHDEMMRMEGVVDGTKLKIPKIGWSKYSDLKNFDLVDEGEKFDTNLSNKNPGISVNIAKKTYQYKGYGNTYRVMESGDDAIKRARIKYFEDNEALKKANK